MRWTEAQDDVLVEYGSLGAEECRRMLRRECGVVRSVSSIQSRASRLGLSLARYEVCPLCGKVVAKLTRTGHCETCRVRTLAEGQKRENERIRMELLKGDEPDADAVREYDLWRKRNSLERKEL